MSDSALLRLLAAILLGAFALNTSSCSDSGKEHYNARESPMYLKASSVCLVRHQMNGSTQKPIDWDILERGSDGSVIKARGNVQGNPTQALDINKLDLFQSSHPNRSRRPGLFR